MDPNDSSHTVDAIIDAVEQAVIVDREVLAIVLTGLLARGHVLLEDVPGTGKTLTARSFAAALGLSFSRIQFTPDLLPADVTGTQMYNEHTATFEFDEGPVFANVVLADEINRASPKTQAALLEAMEERQVTVAGTTHALPEPFFVIATQNAAERGEGTFPLPEAQLDRFLAKTSLGYPAPSGELELLDRRDGRRSRSPTVETVVSNGEIESLLRVPETVTVHPDLKRYIVDVVQATREDPRVRTGISPRGSQRLFESSRAWVVSDGRGFVTPDDVKAIAIPILAHRLVLTPDARVSGVEKADIIRDILDEVRVPTLTRTAPA